MGIKQVMYIHSNISHVHEKRVNVALIKAQTNGNSLCDVEHKLPVWSDKDQFPMHTTIITYMTETA